MFSSHNAFLKLAFALSMHLLFSSAVVLSYDEVRYQLRFESIQARSHGMANATPGQQGASFLPPLRNFLFILIEFYHP